MATPEREEALKLMETATLAMRATTEHYDAEILTGWCMVATFTQYSDEGGETNVSVYMPETMSSWQQIGLLQAGRLMVEQDFLEIPTDES